MADSDAKTASVYIQIMYAMGSMIVLTDQVEYDNSIWLN